MSVHPRKSLHSWGHMELVIPLCAYPLCFALECTLPQEVDPTACIFAFPV